MDLNFPPNGFSSRSYFPPPPPGNSFSRHRALRGGIMDEDYRTDYTADSFKIRYMIRSELEKERIREEVIAEMARKQALDEVRRVILMEKEFSVAMMHRLYDSNDGLTTKNFADYGVVGATPFQRHPGAMMPEAKSDPQGKLLVLPKTKDSDLERKAEKPARTLPNELPVIGVKTKPKELSCALCQVTATSEQALDDHIRGKKHKAVAAKLKATKHRTNSKVGKQQRKKYGKKKNFRHNSNNARFKKQTRLNQNNGS